VTPKPNRTERHDKALSSAEKKLAKQAAKTGKPNRSFLGSKIRRINQDNS
jgi:hypothetical protein